MLSRVAFAAVGLGSALLLVGCADKAASSAASTATITVEVSDSACSVVPTQVAAGPATFAITNRSSLMTEFYVYDAAGTKILTEKPDIGPGIATRLGYDFAPGTYTLACRPNGTGNGQRTTLSVGPATA